MRKRTAAASVVIGLAAAMCFAAAQEEALLHRAIGHPPESSTDKATIIDSREELDRYLAAVDLEDSPLGLLSMPGLQRFIGSASFTERGLAGFDTEALTLELNEEEAARVLALFGLESIASSLDFDRPHVEPSERYLELSRRFSELSRSAARQGLPDSPVRLEATFDAVYPGTLDSLRTDGAVVPQDSYEVADALRLLHFYAQTADSARLLAATAGDFAGACRLDPNVRGCIRAQELVQHGYDALVDTQQLDAAERFASRFDDLETIQWTMPRSTNSRTPSALALQDEAGEIELEHQLLQLADGTHLIAAVSPTCAPSRRALAWIEANAEDEPALLDIRLLHSPRDLRTNVDRILAFNAESDVLQMEIATGRSAWPESVEFDQTPIFYAVQDGRVVEKLIGWPSDETGARLIELVRSVTTTD